MLSLVTLVLLSQRAPDEGLAQARQAARTHGGLGVAASVVATRTVFVPSGGLTGEVGVTFGDRVTLVFRSHVTTVVVFTNLNLAVGADVALGERVSLGAALGPAFLLSSVDVGHVFLGQLHVRVQVALSERAPTQLSRRGFKLFLEATPGVVLGNAAERWSMGAVLGLLHAW